MAPNLNAQGGDGVERRIFISKLGEWAIALLGGTALAGPLAGDPRQTADTSAGAERADSDAEPPVVVAGLVKYPGDGVTLQGYLARPASGGPHPAVLLFDSRAGWSEQTRETALDYARRGFFALAPDPLSRRGGSVSFPSRKSARDGFVMLSENHRHADRDAALRYLQSHPLIRPERIEILELNAEGASG
jgi:carboxymethylenebutenolidase